jgi:hypothetical protein
MSSWPSAESDPAGPDPAEPITVLGSGWTVDSEGALHPTLVLDVLDRPDVSDLPRVHALDGVGDLTTSLRPDADGVLLDVAMTSPVRAAFSLRVPLPQHRDVLAAAAAANRLVLATTEPTGAGAPLWLAIDLDGPRLAEVLAGLER